jgi:hypothetical protein
MLALSVFLPIFIAAFLPFFFMGERSRAAREKARARRIAEAKLNARLLRFNL